MAKSSAGTVVRKGPAPAPAPAPTPPSSALAPQTNAVARLAQNMVIELAPFAQGEALIAYKERAATILVVTGKDSHQAALEAIRDGKALARGIDEHWRKVLRWLEDRKREIRGIMDDDLAMAEPHVKRLSALCVSYEDGERRRVREEEDRQRAEQERIAREARERELAAMEKAALDAESRSDDLSERERLFVQDVYRGNRPANAAFTAGYKDPEKQAERLMHTPKITAAIEGMRQAQALREQAKAVEQKPVEVKKVEVESNLGRVSGSRTVTTWTAECVDYRAFVNAFQRGDVDIETFCEMSQASETGGNAKARALKENVDRIPGWRHIKKETKAA